MHARTTDRITKRFSRPVQVREPTISIRAKKLRFREYFWTAVARDRAQRIVSANHPAIKSTGQIRSHRRTNLLFSRPPCATQAIMAAAARYRTTVEPFDSTSVWCTGVRAK